MIIGPDFIWLHFPKCAGSSVEHALRVAANGRDDINFDPLNQSEIIWHDTIPARRKRDPTFDPGDRKIICCIRRLPHWLLSRVHFEAQRPPHRIVERSMLVKGKVFEHDGNICKADAYMYLYNNPAVDCWIRCEQVAKDFHMAFKDSLHVTEESSKELLFGRKNIGKINYIRDLSFHFTPNELMRLYEANPYWAGIEERLYGNLLTHQ